jgi:hypothetical protein
MGRMKSYTQKRDDVEKTCKQIHNYEIVKNLRLKYIVYPRGIS